MVQSHGRSSRSSGPCRRPSALGTRSLARAPAARHRQADTPRADAGEAIGDIDVLREQAGVLGPVASAPTVWRILDEVTGTRLKRLQAGRARTRRHVWALLGDGVPSSGVAGADPSRSSPKRSRRSRRLTARSADPLRRRGCFSSVAGLAERPGRVLGRRVEYSVGSRSTCLSATPSACYPTKRGVRRATPTAGCGTEMMWPS